jgi:hypothetical protein
MQFREAGNKIQCLATYYDKEAKRGRQKLVYTLDKYGAAKLPVAADLADFGTAEEREKWAKEIVEYSTASRAEADKNSVIFKVTSLRTAVDVIVADRNSQTGVLTDQHMDQVKEAMLRLLPILGLSGALATTRKAIGGGKGASDPRAAGEAAVERAKTLRSEGLSIAAVAERMTSEGQPVSKSWVQKWTS